MGKIEIFEKFLKKCSNRRDIEFGTLEKIEILRSSYTRGFRVIRLPDVIHA